MKSVLTVLALAFVAMIPPSAEACSTCRCGDPTLTTLGAEKPYAGRFRFSLENRFASEEIGSSAVNRHEIHENQILLSSAYVPTSRWVLGISLPLEWKTLDQGNGAHDEVFGLGDLWLQNRIVLFANEEAGNHHMFGLLAGFRAPTAPRQKNSAGTPLDQDVQPGTGAWYPRGGGWYNFYQFPFMLNVSGIFQYGTTGWDEFQAGEAVLTNATFQYHLNYKFGLQLGLNSRWSAKDTEFRASDPNSGGWITFASPGFVASLAQDLLLHFSVMVPAINQLNGDHDEGINFFGGITYDM